MSQQKEIGTLVVVVLKAQHLHQPSFYKQNPYAQVSLSGQKKRTKVDPKGGQHPMWDDELRFPVLADDGRDKVNRILEVCCYKEEQRGEDVLLGRGSVDIEGTLKTGEFDDWVSLETSAGARGEVYLEMTFYANSPPPLTRRPSKLNPSDRLARPAAYFSPSQQSTPSSASPSPRREHSPAERKPSQTSPAGVNQIPSSLIPARGPQSQPSRQPPSNGGALSAVAMKPKDSLPSLPANDDSREVGSGTNSGVPAALHPGGRSGPRPMPPLNRTRVTSMGRPPPEMLLEQLHRRALSDTPGLTPFSQLQASLQTYSPGMTSTTWPRIGPAPSIIVEEHVEEHSHLGFPTPLAPSPGPFQEHESLGNASGSFDSFNYGPPGQVCGQPISHSYTPAPVQGYSQTMPSQSPHIRLGHDAPPLVTSPSSHPQQYSAHSGGTPSPQPLSPPQVYSHLHSSSQPQQRQSSYPPQPQQYPHFQQQPPQTQQYLPPPQQQQYHPQHLHYAQTPHIPNVPQRCQESTIAPPPQLPLYSETPQQSHFAVPLPPSAQSQTPQSHTPLPTHQPQSHFSPPPPPPPLFNNQGRGGFSTVSAAAPSQTSAPPSASSRGQTPPSMGQNPTPAPMSFPLLTTTPAPSSVVNTPTFLTEERERPIEEGMNEAKLVAVTESDTEMGEKGRLDQPKGFEERESYEDKENWQQIGDVNRQHDSEESQKQTELKRREEEERRRKEEEEHKIREGEERRKREDEERKEREEEERRRREQEGRKRREEEEWKKREEDERRKREEEYRKREEERRRQEEEERRRREEEEHRRREEEEAEHRRRVEAERRWQEELARIRARAEQEAADAAFARAQMEAEEAERRRQEEADLALLRQAHEEAQQEERLAQERRRQEEADMEVARREQAHEEELERRRQEERRRRTEEADRQLARQLDMELNMGTEHGEDRSRQRGLSGRH